jgi:hypothetical protein
MRIAREASNCGQQITLATNGAKANQQSIAVITHQAFNSIEV